MGTSQDLFARGIKQHRPTPERKILAEPLHE
jgi:hypothetical protein